MRYQVEIISLDANVEEAVVLKVKEHTLECFIRYDGLYPEGALTRRLWRSQISTIN